MTEERDCCSLPLYDSPEVCSRCHDLDGITVIQSIEGKKGTGMGVFAAWMSVKMTEYFGRGRVFPRFLDGEALTYLRLKANDGDFLRASGDCVCPKCGHLYREHPEDKECPTFVLLCTGEVMKL